LESQGRKLFYQGGAWWEYKDGAWFPWVTANEEAMDAALLRLARVREFPLAAPRAGLWVMLRAHFGSEKVVTFDAEPAVVCRNKTYFLKADKVEPHSPNHFLTRRIDVDLNLKAKCPEWLKMLNRIFEDRSDITRRETIDFLQ